MIEGLRPLLGNSVFVTNGEIWRAQRRIIDPAFDSGRLREILPAMHDAAEAAVQRLGRGNGQPIDVEEAMSHVAAEMQRQGFDVPLLIGGATTSRARPPAGSWRWPCVPRCWIWSAPACA